MREPQFLPGVDGPPKPSSQATSETPKRDVRWLVLLVVVGILYAIGLAASVGLIGSW